MSKVTVCMATYNGGQFVVEQARSILDQLPRGGTLLCRDDGSSDDTVGLLKSIADPRIVVRKNPSNLGVARNFEVLLSEGDGDVFFLADQDDVWLPNKVNAVLSRLAERRHGLIVHNCHVADTDLSRRPETLFDQLRPKRGFISNWTRNSLVGATMALTDTLRRFVLPFPSCTRMHDIWIGLVAAAFSDIGVIDEPLMVFRRHSTNASSTLTRSRRPIITRAMDRAALAHAIARRKLSVISSRDRQSWESWRKNR